MTDMEYIMMRLGEGSESEQTTARRPSLLARIGRSFQSPAGAGPRSERLGAS